jgi:hypothetical protein
MRLQGILVSIAAMLLLLVGCNRQSSISLDEPEDTGADTDSDTDSDVDTDGDSDSDSDSDSDDWVGTECDPTQEPDPCAIESGDPEAFCFAWDGAPGGFCTRECQAATYEIPIQEDCPTFDGVVCMDISSHTPTPADDEVGYGICVEECMVEPLGEEGPCKASYNSCNPEAWSVESQWATCLLPKCQDGSDCLVVSGIECTGDGDCNTPEGEYCSDDGYCVFEADCDIASGRCFWEAGDPDADPGDPCDDAHDCGASSICLQPVWHDDGMIEYANGYCTRYGCKAANASAENGSGSDDPLIEDEFGCGMMGTCHAGFDFGGACLKRCNPPHDQDAFRCRQQCWDTEFLDQNGQYECDDLTEFGYFIYTSGNTELYNTAAAPMCIPPRPCSDESECSTPTTCRDHETGEPADTGYCLDETTSGPTETWDTDTGT